MNENYFKQTKKNLIFLTIDSRKISLQYAHF